MMKLNFFYIICAVYLTPQQVHNISCNPIKPVRFIKYKCLTKIHKFENLPNIMMSCKIILGILSYYNCMLMEH